MAISNTIIRLKKSGETGNVPADLNYGEVAINYADGKLFYKNGVGIKFINNQDTFSTVNVDGSLVLASGTSDVLSFVAGNNVTFSTNVVSKSITINSTAPAIDSYARDKANGAFDKANNALANTTGTFNGDLSVTGIFKSLQSAGDEGGEIQFEKPQTNTSINGSVVIDVYQNKIRFFESGGSNRGAYIDLTSANTGVDSNLLAGGGGGTDTIARNAAFAAFDKANSANILAQAAFDKANTGSSADQFARDTANAAFIQANAANQYANSAYAQANSATSDIVIIQGVNVTQNNRITVSEGVDTGQNTRMTVIEGVDAGQNTRANAINTYAFSAYTHANAAYIHANAAFNAANSASGVAKTGDVMTGQLNVAAGIVTTNTRGGSIITNGDVAAQGNVWVGKSVRFANNNTGITSAAYIQYNASTSSLDFIFG